jgi:hypothetical protein
MADIGRPKYRAGRLETTTRGIQEAKAAYRILRVFALYLKSSVLDADWTLEAFLVISLSSVAFPSTNSLLMPRRLAQHIGLWRDVGRGRL